MNKIRKISTGLDLKNSISYAIGGKAPKGIIHEIIYDNDMWFCIYTIEEKVIQLWKKINKNMVIAIEYDNDVKFEN